MSAGSNITFTLFAMSAAAVAEITVDQEPETGLKLWQWREAGVTLQLIQRLPDQTRAFFQGRGFSSADADTLGRACVFQTIFRNDGKYPVKYDMDRWEIVYQGQRMPLRTREYWQAYWETGDAPKAAQIALRWALLPTRQTFEPGDYNWGMSSFGLDPGETFDLQLTLSIDGRVTERQIRNIVCAMDR